MPNSVIIASIFLSITGEDWRVSFSFAVSGLASFLPGFRARPKFGPGLRVQVSPKATLERFIAAMQYLTRLETYTFKQICHFHLYRKLKAHIPFFFM